MEVPRAELAGDRLDRNRDETTDVEEPESRIAGRPFVVVAEAETELDRHGDGSHAAERPARADAELEIGAFAGSRVGLPIVTQFEREHAVGRQPVRLGNLEA